MFQEIESTKSFLETLNTIEREWTNWIDDLRQCDLEIQDLLHEIELTKFEVQRGYKLSKQLQEVRQRRRKLKNTMEVSRSLRDFMDNNKQLKISLFKVLTSMEKTNEHQDHRKYTPRIRTDISLADG